jgi:hypothetical protein
MRQTASMLEWEQTTIDAHDPSALGRWWATALRWVVVNDDPEQFEIRPEADRLPGILFVSVTDVKQGNNRLHVDLRPDDQDAEVVRLIALGATSADIGQGEQTGIVLADPEGNEFCVLGSKNGVSRPELAEVLAEQRRRGRVGRAGEDRRVVAGRRREALVEVQYLVQEPVSPAVVSSGHRECVVDEL